MRQQIQLWGTRTLMVVLVAVAVQRYGVPLYRQYFTPKKTEVYVPNTKVKEGKFTVSFHEIGSLQAERSVQVMNEIGGKIIYLIPEGTVVKTGDRLVELDTEEMNREIRQKQLAYQNALADVDRVKAEAAIQKETNTTEMEKAEAEFAYNQTELELAKKDLERQKRLASEKLVALSDVEKAEMTVRSRELRVQQGQKDLALKKKDIETKERTKQNEVRNIEYRANMAKFELEEIQLRLKKAVVTAPAPGMVVIGKFWGGDGRRKYKEGDSVSHRQNICELPDLTKMLVKVQVGEADAPKLRLNMPVLIRLEAMPGKLYHGTVKDISVLATEASPWESGSTPGRRNFEVTIAVTESDPKTLKPGMTADVEFICDELKKAVYVPIESVGERNGKTFVFIKNGKRYTRVPVTVGKQNDNFICITKGLKAGQVVALRDPTRPLEQQEAGTGAAGDEIQEKDKKDDKKTVPMPETRK